MYIVDLFGAYTKGRENAIDRNWQDLKNYEAVEQSRNQNDLSALEILRQRIKLPGEVSQFYDQTDASIRANRIGALAQPGMEAITGAKSNYAVDMADILARLRQPIKQTAYNTAATALDKQGVVNNYTGGQVAYMGQIDANGNTRAGNMGWDAGNRVYQTAQGQNVLAAHAPTAAQQQIALSNQAYGNNIAAGTLQGMQTATAIKQQPQQAANTDYMLAQYIAQQQAAQANAGKPPQPTPEVIASYIDLAQAGHTGAIWWLQQHGIDPNSVKPLIPTPTQQAALQGLQASKVASAVREAIVPTVNGVPQNYIGMGSPLADKATAAIQNGQPLAPLIRKDYNGVGLHGLR